MPKLILHVGMHKTGTTAIQNVLAGNASSLEKAGYCYPAVGMSGPTHAGWVNCIDFEERECAQHQLMRDYRKESSIYACNETLEELITQLVDLVYQFPQLDFVMSSECFLEWVDPQLYAIEFGKLFETVEVVFYLREPLSWIRSLNNQYYKDSNFRYDGDLLETPFAKLLDYAQVIARWSDNFGIQNIRLRHFADHGDFDIIEDFLTNVLLIPYPQQALFDLAGGEANRSIDESALRVLKRFNNVTYDYRSHGKLLKLAEVFAGAGGTSRGFHQFKADSELKALIDTYNRVLWTRFNIDSPWW